LRFYDANKKPIAPDVARGVLRWKSNRRIAARSRSSRSAVSPT
jgi:hypothetical protein